MAGVGTLAPNVQIIAVPKGSALVLPSYSKEGLVRVEYLPVYCAYNFMVAQETFVKSGIDPVKFKQVLENIVDKATSPSNALYRMAKTFEMLEEGRLINAE
jgi:hypothetical protein